MICFAHQTESNRTCLLLPVSLVCIYASLLLSSKDRVVARRLLTFVCSNKSMDYEQFFSSMKLVVFVVLLVRSGSLFCSRS